MKVDKSVPIQPEREERSPERPTWFAYSARWEAKVPASRYGRVRLARLVIDSRYYSDLSCKRLGTITQMSATALARSFERFYGISPYEYLIRVRTQRAKKLIDRSLQPLEAIAAAVGFKSVAALACAFRRFEKVSISAYCRTARNHLSVSAVG